VMNVDPLSKDVLSVAITLNQKHGAGDLNGNQMKLLSFFRNGYHRKSGIVSTKRHAKKWNTGIRRHLEALSTVSSTDGVALYASFRELTGPSK